MRTAIRKHLGDFIALTMLFTALVPILFAYGGWQTSGFLGGEVCDARRNLPRGLILGVLRHSILPVPVHQLDEVVIARLVERGREQGRDAT